MRKVTDDDERHAAVDCSALLDLLVADKCCMTLT